MWSAKSVISYVYIIIPRATTPITTKKPILSEIFKNIIKKKNHSKLFELPTGRQEWENKTEQSHRISAKRSIITLNTNDLNTPIRRLAGMVAQSIILATREAKGCGSKPAQVKN
jgi:hypothetical protein